MRTAGLFDLQVNGFAGVDFNDAALTPEAFDHALEAMLRTGVTGCLPTLISATVPDLERRFRALDRAVAESRLGPQMVPGYHLEGPFLSAEPGFRGCHPAEAMTDPSIALIDRLEASLRRPILLVTLAPEREGAVEVIKALVARGKVVAMGHSAAGYAAVDRAAEAGLSLSTHLGNGLPKLLPKLENPLLAQLACRRITATLIADGIHIPTEALRALVRLKGVERTVLVTDAVAAAAAPPGKYTLGFIPITLHADGVVRQGNSEYLAGAALSLDQAIRNLTSWGVADFPAAVDMASARPLAQLEQAMAAHNTRFDPGNLRWSHELRPSVERRGRVTAV